MLGAVPPVAVVIHLVNLGPLTVADPKHRRHASIGADRDARIDGFDVASFWEDLQLDEFLGQRITIQATARCAPYFASN
jgi:hypothetical protein